jgi:GNAT superfamily N-acetyltransferase
MRDLGLLVRHRRYMWEAISDHPVGTLDVADSVYRRWARVRMRSNRFAGFIVEVGGVPAASGCVWLMSAQPRPGRQGTTVAYLLSLFTEPSQRGRGHAARIVRAAMRWARSRGVTVMMLHASDFGESVYRRLGFERTREMRCILSPPSRVRTRPTRKPKGRGAR